MELRIFNRELEPLGIVDEAISVIWQPSYWDKGDYGDVKILAPITENNTALLVNCGVVVGGTSFAGGVGGIPQTAIGLLLFSLLENAMNSLMISPYVQQATKGILIVLIIWLDCHGAKKKSEDV